MSRRKKCQGHGPRQHRLRRPARLASARDWMASGAQVTIQTYAKRFGLDRYTAYDELTMLGVPLSSGDLQWATRPPSVREGGGYEGGPSPRRARLFGWRATARMDRVGR